MTKAHFTAVGVEMAKAKKSAKALKEGVQTKGSKKIRTKPRFRRPQTLHIRKTQVVVPREIQKRSKMDDFRVLKLPLTSEAALKKVELHNTIVFLCDVKATKPQIKAAFERRFGVKVAKCNTLIRMDGQKKAFVKLAPTADALELANKIGIL